MSYTKMRVDIPKNPKLLIDLASEIYARHLADGAQSPLNNLVANNWSTEGPKIDLCRQKHEEAEALKAKMEEAYKERDLLLTDIDNAVHASRDILTGVHHDNMKRLSEWGFMVVEAARSGPKKQDNSNVTKVA